MARWTIPPGAEPVLKNFLGARVAPSPVGRIDIDDLHADFLSWLTYSGAVDLTSPAGADWLKVDRRSFSAWMRALLQNLAVKQVSHGRYFLQGVTLKPLEARGRAARKGLI